MSLALVGWAVVHSLWQGLFIAGVTAMLLGLLRDPRACPERAPASRGARVRYLIAYASLAVMALTAVVTAFTGTTSIGSRVRYEMLMAVDSTLGASLPTFVWWASIIVPAAGAVWLAGLGVWILRIGFEWRRARTLVERDLSDVGHLVRVVVEDLRAEMAIDTLVQVRYSAAATVPMVLGWRHPLILLPTGTLATLTRTQLRTILAHELAHVRRGDYAANLMQIAAETLLFHHPAARWVSRRIRTEREYCCDDVAVEVARDAGVYARALAALDDARGECRLAVAAASGTLLDRIQRIAGQPRPTLTPARGVVALVTASLLAAVMLAITMTVPPGLPAGAQLRRRTPPPGITQPINERALPRTPRR